MAKQYDNRLFIKGWVTGGRWGIERYLYSLHRITGVGLLIYFVIHIFVTTSRVYGFEAWSKAMGAFAESWFRYGEIVVFLGFAFHAGNGLRLLLIELGFLVGKAEEPVYPYRSSLNVQRPTMIIIMVVVAIISALGMYNFFYLKAH